MRGSKTVNSHVDKSLIEVGNDDFREAAKLEREKQLSYSVHAEIPMKSRCFRIRRRVFERVTRIGVNWYVHFSPVQQAMQHIG